MNIKAVENYLLSAKIKAVESIDVENKTIKYNEKILSHEHITKLNGDEELVRAVVLTQLVNIYKYKLENIELEKTYDIGRPKVNKPQIDIIVKDKQGNTFMFIELKAFDKYENEKEEALEKQLFNLAAQESINNKINYLVYLTCDLEKFAPSSMIIDYSMFQSYEKWNEQRVFTDEIPTDYGRAIKQPYIKGGKKDLEKTYTGEQIDYLRQNLHNVLWGGGRN